MGVTYFKRYRMEIDLTRPIFALPRLADGYSLLPWSDKLLPVHAEVKYKSFRDELDSIPEEPLLPIEKKLIAGSLLLGLVLLGLLLWISATYFPVVAVATR